MSENPIHALTQLLDDRLKARDNLERFIEVTAAKTGHEDVRSYRNFVWHVRAGRKNIPKGHEEIWARALGFLPDTQPWRAFLALVDGARAFSKKDARAHLERLEAENATLRAENHRLTLLLNRQTRQLTDSDTELAAVVAKVKGRRLPRPGDEPETLR